MKRKNKIIIAIIFFLIAGIYFDIVPFRRMREKFYFGIGNKHTERYETTRIIKDKDTGEIYDETSWTGGCTDGYEENIKRHGVSGSFFGRGNVHYIDLRFLSKVIEEPVDESEDIINTTKEQYEEFWK